jgi:ABC transporter, substrate-binding protein
MMVCILLLTGCSESNDTDEDDMIKAEESSGISAVSLVIGSDNYEPYNYIDESGENVGIDVDIAKEACRRLGITPVFKQITWDRKDSFLDSNEIDCLWGSFTMSGRTDDYRWAGPYMYSRQVVVARKDRGINSFADLKGKRIAVQSTSKPEHIILSGEDDRIQGVSAVYSMSTMSELYASLRKGYIDAAAGHEVAIKRFVDTNPQQFIILDETLYKSELGVAFKKGRCDDIPDILNDILKQMIDDGTIKKIAESYGINADISMGDN